VEYLRLDSCSLLSTSRLNSILEFNSSSHSLARSRLAQVRRCLFCNIYKSNILTNSQSHRRRRNILFVHSEGILWNREDSATRSVLRYSSLSKTFLADMLDRSPGCSVRSDLVVRSEEIASSGQFYLVTIFLGNYGLTSKIAVQLPTLPVTLASFSR